MGRSVDVDDLIDPARVAEIIGLSNPNGVSVYERRYPDFPKPAVATGRCRLWIRAEVVEWAAGRGSR